MDTSSLSQQVNAIIEQLHGLFDDIGVSHHDREVREAKLFAALSDTLHNQVTLVSAEKRTLMDEAQRTLTATRQMEASLHGEPVSGRSGGDDSDCDLKITFPLSRCLQILKERHSQVSRLHRERFEQVKKLVDALESYSSHLESSFVRIPLPPTGPKQSIPTSFDLSPAYVDQLDQEFTRVYEEYTRRVATVQALADHIIQLWAELGTPQAQTEPDLVKYYRDAPEQLGLHEGDIARLRAQRDRLADEKKTRERRLRDLRATVDTLWRKLGINEAEQKTFLNNNRGCGVRQINEFEAELARLAELKRQNLHLFVEEARCRLQELWDGLYFGEDEMLDFTPAFSDVYSDALLEAHEREVARLEALREQRAPTLALVDRHRALLRERDELAASSQDASRLTLRGQRGEKRDPGKLLREEKMRKRIAKDLPRVEAGLRQALEAWEDEFGRPFTVHGERYLDLLDADQAAHVAAPGPRCKTPSGGNAVAPPSASAPCSAVSSAARPPSQFRSNSAASARTMAQQQPPSSLQHVRPGPGIKTPRRPPASGATSSAIARGSPSRIPARAPLSTLKYGNNSPERHQAGSFTDASSRNKTGPFTAAPPPKMRAPPIKMRNLGPVPERNPAEMQYEATRLEPYTLNDGRPQPHLHSHEPRPNHYHPQHSHHPQQLSQFDARPEQQHHHDAGSESSSAPRQLSGASHGSTAASGSENWETYDDNSEPERDASDTYYAKLRATRGKRGVDVDAAATALEARASPAAAKRFRGMAPPPLPPAFADGAPGRLLGTRVGSGSEWTDEDAV